MLRAFGASRGADLGGRPAGDRVGLCRFHRGSLLALVRLWCGGRLRACVRQEQAWMVPVPYGVPLSGCSWSSGARTNWVRRSLDAPISW